MVFIAQLGAIRHPNSQILMVVFGSGYSTFHEKTYQRQRDEKETISTTDCFNPNVDAEYSIRDCD